MSEVKVTVLYPQPTDADTFEQAYEAHKELVAEFMPGYIDYSVVRFMPNMDGSPAPYYMMAILTYPSGGVLNTVMSNPDSRKVGKDAMRISTGGAPVILVGT